MGRSGANRSKTKLPKKQRSAAQLVAEDTLTDRQIAKRCNIALSTLENWKQGEAFRAVVAEVRERIDQEIMSRGIARRAKRVQTLEDQWEKMKQVIRERAVDPVMDDVAGGKTGLLVRTEKSIGSGPGAKIVEEFAVDTGLLKELREHAKQAAIELGQWTEKRELSNAEGNPFEIRVVEVVRPNGSATNGTH